MSPLDALASRITNHSTVIFLGGTDAGKTTLIRQVHDRVGGEVVDADLGQSEIGPPAVISLGTYRKGPRAGYFAGDISPRGHSLHVLTGIYRMVQEAARPCLIDTDGYIGEGAARALKSETINLIRPDLIVLLQRRGELEYYKLFTSKGIELVDVPVEHHGSKSPEERIKAREAAFRSYFAQAHLRSWQLKDVRFERSLLAHGEPLDADSLGETLECPVSAGWKRAKEAIIVVDGFAPSPGVVKRALGVEDVHLTHASDLRNLLVGCVDGDAFSGLGILQAIRSERVEVLTPVKETTVLQAGSLQVHPDGRHSRIRLFL